MRSGMRDLTRIRPGKTIPPGARKIPFSAQIDLFKGTNLPNQGEIRKRT